MAQADREPRVEIEYCTQCNWLLRAAWVAQELLQTFRGHLREVALVPGTGGVFQVRLATASEVIVLWDRATDGGTPDIPALKRAVRDVAAPDLALGHTDRAGEPQRTR